MNDPHEIKLAHTIVVPGVRTWWDAWRRRSPVRYMRVEMSMTVLGAVVVASPKLTAKYVPPESDPRMIRYTTTVGPAGVQDAPL